MASAWRIPDKPGPGYWINVLDGILDHVFILVALGLLFGIGAKKAGGLVSKVPVLRKAPRGTETQILTEI